MEQTPLTAPAHSETLRLLSIFHYIFASFAVFGIGFLFLHHRLVNSMFAGEDWSQHPNPPPEAFVEMLTWFYVVFGVILLLGLVLNLLVAISLRQRRRWMLCAVVSGLNCLQIPIGTALGVFTLVTLNRDEVRRSFAR